MMYDYDQLGKILCERLCAEVQIVKLFDDDTRMIETPFTFPDGDPYPIYLKESPSGGVRLTDRGHTLMRISYDRDVDLLYESDACSALREQILHNIGMEEDRGAFFIDCKLEDLPSAIFRFGQGIGQIYDILFLSPSRGVSPSQVKRFFNKELEKTLYRIIDKEKIEKRYVFRRLHKAQNYRVDFRIWKERQKSNLLIFGVSNNNKALRTTVTLEHLRRHPILFESLLIFKNREEIYPRDIERLMNAGDHYVFSLNQPEISQKINEMMAA